MNTGERWPVASAAPHPWWQPPPPAAGQRPQWPGSWLPSGDHRIGAAVKACAMCWWRPGTPWYQPPARRRRRNDANWARGTTSPGSGGGARANACGHPQPTPGPCPTTWHTVVSSAVVVPPRERC